MAAMTSGRMKAWSQGAAFYGNSALGITQREGSAKMHKKGRLPPPPTAERSGDGGNGGARGNEDTDTQDSVYAVESCPDPPLPPEIEADILARASALGKLVRESDVKTPAGMPYQGKVLREENALLFVARLARLVRDRPATAAAPRVAFHWTAEANFQSIADSNLRVPDGQEVKKKHGSALGKGIYTSPDFRFAKEDFSYGASATFMLLVLPGVQEERHPGSRNNYRPLDPTFDSVRGRLPGRPCDTWVLPSSDQVLPCFLVDDIALPAATEVLRRCIALLMAPWSGNLAGPKLDSEPSTKGKVQQQELASVEAPSSAAAGPALVASAALAWLEGGRAYAGNGVGAGDGMESRAAAPGPAAPGLDPPADAASAASAVPTAAAAAAAPAPAPAPASAAGSGRWTRARSKLAGLQGEGAPLDAPGQPRTTAAIEETATALLQEGDDFKARAASAAAARPPSASASALVSEPGSKPKMTTTEAEDATAGVAAGATAAAPSAGSKKRWRNGNKDDLLEGQADATEARETSKNKASTRNTNTNTNTNPRSIGDAGSDSGAAATPEEDGPSRIRTVAANLLDAIEPIIAHQCSCVLSRPAQGVAAALFETFPAADVYRERREKGRPVDPPGTVCIRGSIANLFSQFCPGKALSSSRDIPRSPYAELFSRVPGVSDTKEERLEWFRTALDVLASRWPKTAPRVVAVPARIGCGLAGGHWPDYLKVLQDFARQHNIHVSIYDVEAQPGSVSRATGQVALTVSQHRRQQEQQDKESRPNLAMPTAGTSFWRDSMVEVKSEDGSWVPVRDQVSVLSRVLATLRERDPGSTQDGSVVLEWQDASNTAATEVRIMPGAVPASRLTLPERLAPDVLLKSPLDLGDWLTQRDLQELKSSSSSNTFSSAPAASAAPSASAPASRKIATDATCPICLTSVLDSDQEAVLRLPCGHHFHESCIEEWLSRRRECPTCKRRLGVSIGSQPRTGSMSWHVAADSLPGHSQVGTICLKFHFPSGVDESGERYGERREEAYLPDNPCGRLLLALFQLAFRRCLLFGLGISMALGTRRATFNIHLKTARTGGPNRHGYPDAEYFGRALEELRENGVTADQL